VDLETCDIQPHAKAYKLRFISGSDT